MNKIYQVYQISDSTGETLDRIFLAIKAQFSNFDYKTIHFSFTRTENQIDKIISKCDAEKNVIILYTIVDSDLAKYLALECKKNNVPCFEVLGNFLNLKMHGIFLISGIAVLPRPQIPIRSHLADLGE